MPKSTKRIKKHHKSKKKKWVSMAIYRTPLNPEQAVLSCCQVPGKVQVIFTHQCWWAGAEPCGGGVATDALSS